MTRSARFVVGALIVTALVSTVAYTAANVVAGSNAGGDTEAVTANQLKPPECAALNLTLVTGPGGGGGTPSLIIGTPGNDRIVGGGKDDCILGGAGNDTINAGGGNDVCIGGLGNDTFSGCETFFQ